MICKKPSKGLYFVVWKKMVEKQNERKVKRLRNDNRLEFCNQRIDKSAEDKEIVSHMTCSYTSQ